MSKYEPAIPGLSKLDNVVLWVLCVAATVAIAYLACWTIFYGIGWIMYAGTVDPWARDWAVAVFT